MDLQQYNIFNIQLFDPDTILSKRRGFFYEKIGKPCSEKDWYFIGNANPTALLCKAPIFQ